MKRWRIRYTDEYDRACPVFTWRCRAHDAEHALEKFHSGDSDGWKVLSVDRPKDHRGRIVEDEMATA